MYSTQTILHQITAQTLPEVLVRVLHQAIMQVAEAAVITAVAAAAEAAGRPVEVNNLLIKTGLDIYNNF